MSYRATMVAVTIVVAFAAMAEAQVKPQPLVEQTAGPSLFTAVQDQLGLKLENVKAPLEGLVIDRAERPSEN